MDDGFELPVNYNEKELLFPAVLRQFGYTYRIEVEVDSTIVSFERDEERNWRALVDPSLLEKNKTIKVELLQAILDSIENVSK